MNDKDIKRAYILGNILLNIIKWLFLLLMVVSIGLTIGLIVLVLIYGTGINIKFVNIISGLFLSTSSDKVSELINTYGLNNLLVALIGFGIAKSLTRLMYYLLIDRGITLYKSITLGDLFTRKSNKVVDEMMGISFLATFTLPVFIFVISIITHIDVEELINVGYVCFFVFIALFVLKIILNRGMDVTRENNKYDRIINDYKADIDSLKIQSIKRDAELKKLKNMVKEQEEKQQKKAAPKKKKTVKRTTSK